MVFGIQVVLDLDETLVCAYETSSLPAILRTQAIEAGLKWFELEFGYPDMVSLFLSLTHTHTHTHTHTLSLCICFLNLFLAELYSQT